MIKGQPVIANRPRRSTSHREKVAARNMIRVLGLEMAKKNGWID